MEDAQGNGGGVATAVAMDGGTPPLPPQGGGSEGGAQALSSSSGKLAALSMTTPLLQMTMNEVPRHCGLLNQALQETEDPTPYVVCIEGHIQEVLSASNPERVDGPAAAFFVHALPQYVNVLQGRADIEPKLKARLNQFFQRTMDFIIHRLKGRPLPQHALEVLSLILSNHSRGFFIRNPMEDQLRPFFYEDHDQPDSSSTQNDGTTESRTSAVFARLPPDDQETSVYYLINVDYFGARGGFDVLLAKFRFFVGQLPSPVVSGILAGGSTSTLRFTEGLADERASGDLRPVVGIQDLRSLRLMLSPFLRLQPYFTLSFLQRFAVELQDLSYEIMLSLPEKELKKESTTNIPELSWHLENLVARVLSKDEVEQRDLVFSMRLAHKGLLAQTLDRRLFVVSLLVKILKQIVVDAPGQVKSVHILPFSMYKSPKELVPVSIDVKFFMRWLHDINFTGLLSDANAHIEVIKSASELFLVMAEQDEFSRQDLEHLWGLAHMAQGSFKAAIFDLLLQMASIAASTSELVSLIVEKIEQIPESAFDEPTLQLISHLTLVATKISPMNKKARAHAGFGVPILWRLIQTTSALKPTLRPIAVSSLIKLFEATEFQQERVPFCVRCVDNISKQVSPGAALDLLAKIIDTFPEKKAWRKESRSSVIEGLEAQHQLLSKLFTAMDESSKRGTLQQTVRVGAPSEGQLRQSEVLQFLSYALRASTLALSRQQLELLWDTFVQPKSPTAQVDAFFTWLIKQINDGADSQVFPIFADDAVEQLFVSRVCVLDPESLTLSAYAVFETCFFNLNAHEKRLALHGNDLAILVSMMAAPDGKEQQALTSETTWRRFKSFDVITSSDLIGVEYLWEVALRVVNSSVANLATATLVDMVDHTSALKRKSRLKVREQFLLSCTERISKAVAERAIPEGTNARIVERCLVLLRIFVEQLQNSSVAAFGPVQRKRKEGGEHKRSKSGSFVSSIGKLSISSIMSRDQPKDKALSLSVVVVQRGEPNMPLTIIMQPSDTIRAMKNAVLERVQDELIKTPVAPLVTTGPRPRSRSADRQEEPYSIRRLRDGVEVKIISGGIEFIDGDDTLASMGLADNQRIFAHIIDDDDPELMLDGNTPSAAATARKPRNQLDSEWLEAMQQQLQAIGLGRASSLLTEKSVSISQSGSVSGLVERTASSTTPMGTTSSTMTEGSGRKAPSGVVDLGLQEELGKGSVLLNSQTHFDRLFGLFAVSDTIAHRTWLLLRLLPLNMAMVQRFKDATKPDAKAVDWSTLLDSTNLFRFAYGLQIVNYLCREDTTAGNTTIGGDGAAVWRSAFVELGGAAYLLNVLRGLTEELLFKIARPETGAIACVSLLLEALDALVVDNSYGALPASVSSSAVAAALHSVIPLAFNCLKLPPSLTVIDNASAIPTIRLGTFAAAEAPPPSQIKKAEGKLYAVDLWWSVSSLLSSVALSDATILGEDDLNAVKHGLHLYMAICGSYIEFIRFDSSFGEFLLLLVLRTSEPSVREEAALAFGALCKFLFDQGARAHGGRGVEEIMRLLLAVLPTVHAMDSQVVQYFKLVTRLIGSYGAEMRGSPLLPEGALESIAAILIPMLKNWPLRETVEDVRSGYEDGGLIGLLQLLVAVFSSFPHLKTFACASEWGLLQELFGRCLFEIPSGRKRGVNALPLCKSAGARQAALQLLEELVRGEPANVQEVAALIDKQLADLEVSSAWNVSPPREDAPHGLRGLMNMGNTCYINALLQSLYALPRFRDGVLSVRSTPVPAEEDSTDPNSALLYELQVLFAHLHYGQGGAFNMGNFCGSLRDYQGQRVNLMVQMDVQEFCNQFLDKIDVALKDTEQAKLLEDVFGGAVSNHIICQDCPHRSSREEPFITLSVDVKNLGSLTDSLQFFASGELMDGANKFHCGICDERVTATRRVCISKLPSVLAVHLKRFEFDFELRKNVKLNDRCEFPLRLNVFPYTKQAYDEQEKVSDSASGLAEEDCWYDLVGVLVHEGTADSGHYYSIIKDGNSPADKANWYMFNDARVRPFDIAALDDQCFGGKHSTGSLQRSDSTGSSYAAASSAQTAGSSSSLSNKKPPVPGSSSVRAKNNNAYMLFYARSESAPTRTEVSEADIRPEIIKSVWDTNRAVLRTRQVFSQEYFNFVWEVMQTATQPTVSDTLEPVDHLSPLLIKCATRFVIEVVIRAREQDRYSLGDWTRFLRTAYRGRVDESLWFVQEAPAFAKAVLVSCPDRHVRRRFTKLFRDVLCTLTATLHPHRMPVFLGMETDGSTSGDVSEGDGLTMPERPPPKRRNVRSYAPQDDVDQDHSFDDDDGMSPVSPATRAVIDSLDAFYTLICDMVPELSAPSLAKGGEEVFVVLRDICMLGASERDRLLSKRAVGLLVDYFLAEERRSALRSVVVQRSPADAATGQGLPVSWISTSRELQPLLDVLGLLVRSCKPPGQVDTNHSPHAIPSGQFVLPQDEERRLFDRSFLHVLIADGTYLLDATTLVEYWAWQSAPVTKRIVNQCIDYLKTAELVENHLSILAALLELEDAHQPWRTGFVIGEMCGAVHDTAMAKPVIERTIRWVAKFAQERQMVLTALQSNKDRTAEAFKLAGWDRRRIDQLIGLG